MANSKGPSSIRSMMYSGNNSLLPPKIPFPSISPSFPEYIPSSAIGPRAIPNPREGNSHHQRTSSESFLIEEQPSWLDDLLNEPDTPVRRGHRRSSSDSFEYFGTSSAGNMSYVAQDDSKLRNIIPSSFLGSQDFGVCRDAQHSSLYADPNLAGKNKNKSWDAAVNSTAPPRGLPSPRETTFIPNGGSMSNSKDADTNRHALVENQGPVESGARDTNCFSEKMESSNIKSAAPETDTRRAKQLSIILKFSNVQLDTECKQYAQRSRVRKLQYIAELERNVQALQIEASEVSAELEFLNQQNLILSLENKALNQRLESVSQEQLIKCLEHEVLEREATRLRNLYQQQLQLQLQQQRPSVGHRRANSRDLDQQLANLSLKHNETGTAHDSISNQHHNHLV